MHRKDPLKVVRQRETVLEQICACRSHVAVVEQLTHSCGKAFSMLLPGWYNSLEVAGVQSADLACWVQHLVTHR